MGSICKIALQGGKLGSNHHHGEGHLNTHKHNNAHAHCDHHSVGRKPDSIFKIGITLNSLFVAVELYYGYAIGSLALISDAFHNLTDVFALLIGWLGYSLSQRSASKKYSLYAALFNSCVLLLGSFWVIYEAIERLKSPAIPAANTMIIVASIGFVINFISAKLFHKDHHHDLNMKSAYLHLMADAAISLGVALAGVLIYFYSINWIDPVFSLVISIVIIYGSAKILFESITQLRN